MNLQPAQESASTPSTLGLKLRSDIRFVPQSSSHQWTCVVEDPVAKKFYRIGHAEYMVASALDGSQDPAQLASSLARLHPSDNVDPKTIESTLKWLVNAGLVLPPPSPVQNASLAPDSIASNSSVQPNPTSSSQSKPPQPTGFSLPVDPFSFQFPLSDGSIVEKFASRIQWLCSIPALIGGIALILTAAVTFYANASFFTELGTKLFVPEAALWWAGAWLVLKLFHELGHATFCVAEGAKVRGAGLAFFYLAPMPYVNTTDMWRLPKMKSRAICAGGGMWFELLLACLALVMCRWFENSTWQYFCIALATLGTFTTIAFNANPLIRFDGYYILSDVLDRPMLWTEGQNAFKSLFSGKMMFLSTAVSLHGIPLILFGAGCFASRWLMMIGLAWGTWHAWHGVGLAIIAFASYLWFINPYLKKQRQLAMIGQPTYQLPSKLNVSMLGCAIGIIATVSYFIPSPWQPQVPGILSYKDPVVIRASVDGFIEKVLVEDGRYLNAETSIVEFLNPALSLTRNTVALQLQSSRERCMVLRAQAKIAEMQAEQAKVDSLEAQLEQLNLQSAQTTVKAPVAGRFKARQLSRQVGQFVKTGQVLGIIVPSEDLEASCSISQEDVEKYRESIDQPVFIYLANVGKIKGRVKSVEPRGCDTLESPILAAKYGGPIPVHFVTQDSESKDTLRTNNPRFVATISIDHAESNNRLTQLLSPGQLCRVCLIDTQITVANAVNRWVKAFVNWVKPPQVDSPN